ncbi:hypothetical protein HYZ98_03750 [Candidatus Peregrinibacteria bacterium]|nr:hypothetical protein [Candidatus Peregrinibacteria bacterium]
MGLFSRKPKIPPATPTPTQPIVPPPDFRPLSWEALVTPAHERTKGWYVKGGIVIIILAAWGIITGAWTFSLVLLLIGGIYFLLQNSTPSSKRITIETRGVTFDGVFTPWTSLQSFWIIQTPTYSELHFKTKNIRQSPIVIQTGFTDPNILRKTLSAFLPEDSNREEGVIDMIIRICKL